MRGSARFITYRDLRNAQLSCVIPLHRVFESVLLPVPPPHQLVTLCEIELPS